MPTSPLASKLCEHCGLAYERRQREAFWQFEVRRFCGHQCSDKGRRTTRVDNAEFKARYRQLKVNGRRVLEHRYVMEQALRRPLLQSEQVHHINHDRLDNRLVNLELVTVAEHGLRHTWQPIVKICVVCEQEFTPHKTKRARQQTCGSVCKRKLLSIRWEDRR